MTFFKHLFSTAARAARSFVNRSWKAVKRVVADAFDSVCDGIGLAWAGVLRPAAELMGISHETLDRIEETGGALRVVIVEAASRTAAILEADVRELWDEALIALRAAAARLIAAAEESWDEILGVLGKALDELRGEQIVAHVPVILVSEETPPSASQVPILS